MTMTTDTLDTIETPEFPYGVARVGDLWASHRPDQRMADALAVIATFLHPLFDTGWTNAKHYMPPGKSKDSCILCSITVRDFLYRVGFRDASVRSVEYHMAEHGEPGSGVNGPEQRAVSRTLDIGADDNTEVRPDRWNGHLVVIVEGWLIDTTLYQATPRPEWPNFPPMWATKLRDDLPLAGGKRVLAEGFHMYEDKHVLHWMWLDRPDKDHGFRTAPDFVQKWRRERVVDALVKAFKAMVK
jgi:hypothetical protein